MTGKFRFQYIRNIETKNVIGFNAVHQPAQDGFEDVIVIPAADWERMVELVTRTFPACPCDGNCCESCREDAEIEAIIAKVKEANNV
jgi:hypothetical protein